MYHFIIPCFNEENRLHVSISNLQNFFSSFMFPYELIFVDDGSNDQTYSLLNNFKKNTSLHISIVHYQKNKGKGYAIQQGIKRCLGKSNGCFIMDADLATSLDEIYTVLNNKSLGPIHIGVRSGNNVHSNLSRRFAGLISNKIINVILGLSHADTQCGFKYFDTTVYHLFDNIRNYRWGYDFEILFLAKKHGYNVNEQFVRWENGEGSKVKFIDYLKTFGELLSTKWYHGLFPQIQTYFSEIHSHYKQIAFIFVITIMLFSIYLNLPINAT